MNLLTTDRLIFLVGFPILITIMIYLSAVLGFKGQGAWLNSKLYAFINRGPRWVKLILAASAGAVTPFCSCTSIPGFIVILEGGLGLDTALAFLIASPTIDPAGTLLLVWLIGLKLSMIYLIGCFITAILGGWLLGKIFTMQEVNSLVLLGYFNQGEKVAWREALRLGWQYIRGFWWVIILSTVLGFVFYDYVPASVTEILAKSHAAIAIPLAALTGSLIYAHMAVVAPIGAALLSKGVGAGVVLTFLASVAGISPPEIILLRKIISTRLIVAYIGTTLIMLTMIGLVVNWIK